jgi:Helix-turn-helix domain
MSTIDYPKVVKETLKELRQKEREQSKAFVRDRIRFLRLLKNGRCSSQGRAAELIGLCARSGQRLWKLYQKGGLKALLSYPYQGTACRLTAVQREQLNAYLAMGIKSNVCKRLGTTSKSGLVFAIPPVDCTSSLGA